MCRHTDVYWTSGVSSVGVSVDYCSQTTSTLSRAMLSDFLVVIVVLRRHGMTYPVHLSITDPTRVPVVILECGM